MNKWTNVMTSIPPQLGDQRFIQKIKCTPPGSKSLRSLSGGLALTRYMAAGIYAALPGPDYIRLLHLDSACDDQHAITASLETCHLDNEDIPYCPLSYSWGRNSDGDASLTHRITLNGLSTLVTENLFQGLVQLRHRKEKLGNVFWIDALCINQADNRERTEQVAIMWKIYSRGSNTVIWLGASEAEASEAIEVQALTSFARYEQRWDCEKLPPLDGVLDAPTLMQLAHRHNLIRKELPYHGLTSHISGRFDEQQLRHCQEAIDDVFRRLDVGEMQRLLSTIEDTIAATTNVLERRYFQRRWIIQELHHSARRPIFVLLGEHQMLLTDMMVACERFDESFLGLSWIFQELCVDGSEKIPGTWEQFYTRFAGKNRLAELNQKVINVAGLERGVDFWAQDGLPLRNSHIIRNPDQGKKGRWREFMWCLHDFDDMGCKEAIDRVYALHSLLGSHSTFYPDYSLTKEMAYIMVAKSMAQEGFLDAILNDACSQYNSGLTSSLLLPSWVPDFGLPLWKMDKQYKYRKMRRKKEIEVAFAKNDGMLQVGASLANITDDRVCNNVLEGLVSGNVLCLLTRREETHSIYQLEPVAEGKAVYKIINSYQFEQPKASQDGLLEDLFGEDPTYRRICLV